MSDFFCRLALPHRETERVMMRVAVLWSSPSLTPSSRVEVPVRATVLELPQD